RQSRADKVPSLLNALFGKRYREYLAGDVGFIALPHVRDVASQRRLPWSSHPSRGITHDLEHAASPADAPGRRFVGRGIAPKRLNRAVVPDPVGSRPLRPAATVGAIANQHPAVVDGNCAARSEAIDTGSLSLPELDGIEENDFCRAPFQTLDSIAQAVDPVAILAGFQA